MNANSMGHHQPSSFSSSCPTFVFRLFLLLMALFPPLPSSSSPFSVSVRCSALSMELFVQFHEPFHGRLKTRPNGFCFVNGRGRNRVGLRLPLDDDHRQKCAIVRRDTEYVAIVDLEMNPDVVTAEDNAYFVRCPIDTAEKGETEEADEKRTTMTSSIRVKSTAAADEPIGQDEKPSAEKPSRKVMQSTTMAMALRGESAGEGPFWQGPKAEAMLRLALHLDQKDGTAFALRLRKCIAFSPSSDSQRPIRAVQISDENGCPIIANGPLPSSSDQSDHRLHFQVPKFGDDQPKQQQTNGEGVIDDHFFIQCEVTINGQQLAEEEKESCHRTSAASDSAEHPSRRLHFPPSDASTNEVSSSSSSSSSFLIDHLSFLSIFLSVFLIFCSLFFICFFFWYCPNGLPMNARKWTKTTNGQASPSAGRCCSAATASVTPSSSSTVCPVGIGPLSLRFPMAFSPLTFPAEFPPEDASSRPFSPPVLSADFASSLDSLPEPPSLTLQEVRQLNDAFNGIKMGKDSAFEHDPKFQQQKHVYSFAGIRLTNRNGNGTTERH